jgi:hypothetical protein
MRRKRPVSRAVLWCGIWLMCGVASIAHASTAVVVPPHVDPGIASEASEPELQELVRLIKAHGFDVISPGQAAAAAEDAQQSGSFPKHIHPDDCRDAECATEYRKLFDASVAVQLALTGQSGKVREVGVVISESASANFTGSASVQGGDLKGAVQAAYAAARDKQLRGEGPWLSVAGSPAGAQVYVDGAEYGSLPFERRHIEPGNHRLELRSDGFISQTLAIDVPARIDHEQRMEITLAPLHDSAEPKLDRTWDYVVGGAFAVLGAVHLGMGVQQKLKAGDCSDTVAGVCTARYGDDDGVARENLLLGLGAASLAVGGAIIGGAPIARLRLNASRQTALLSVGGSF